MNCIDCGNMFKRFVHNQTRCEQCVTNKNIKEGNLSKELNKRLHKNCEWCSTEYKMSGPASRYCSKTCALDFKRAHKYKLNYTSFTELVAADKCTICDSTGFTMDSNRYDSGLVIDHCHTTGVVRGMLCHNCNRALGLLQDDVSLLNRAIHYLERATTIPQGSTPKQVEAQSSLTS